MSSLIIFSVETKQSNENLQQYVQIDHILL